LSQAGQEEAHCYWHDSGRIKNEPDVKERLEALARAGERLEGFSLRNVDLEGVNLVNYGAKVGFDLSDVDLYRANLQGAHLFKVILNGASLMKSDLRYANLHCADLSNSNILGVKFDGAKIEQIEWGESLLQDQQAVSARLDGNQEMMLDYYLQSEEIYRNLRKAAEARGLFELAGDFFHREMVMRRLQMPAHSYRRAISKAVDLFSGYGERPLRVILFSVLLITFCAGIYFFMGIQDSGVLVQFDPAAEISQQLFHFLTCLYFSVVTFTTLGYGDLVPIGGARVVAAAEAFFGAFTLALFVVVFVKKMTR